MPEAKKYKKRVWHNSINQTMVGSIEYGKLMIVDAVI